MMGFSEFLFLYYFLFVFSWGDELLWMEKVSLVQVRLFLMVSKGISRSKGIKLGKELKWMIINIYNTEYEHLIKQSFYNTNDNIKKMAPSMATRWMRSVMFSQFTVVLTYFNVVMACVRVSYDRDFILSRRGVPSSLFKPVIAFDCPVIMPVSVNSVKNRVRKRGTHDRAHSPCRHARRHLFWAAFIFEEPSEKTQAGEKWQTNSKMSK